jgi:hypothetical protein
MMSGQAMTWGTDSPEPHRALLQDRVSGTELPLDFLVQALNQAVARKLASRRHETHDSV